MEAANLANANQLQLGGEWLVTVTYLQTSSMTTVKLVKSNIHI